MKRTHGYWLIRVPIHPLRYRCFFQAIPSRYVCRVQSMMTNNMCGHIIHQQYHPWCVWLLNDFLRFSPSFRYNRAYKLDTIIHHQSGYTHNALVRDLDQQICMKKPQFAFFMRFLQVNDMICMTNGCVHHYIGTYQK